MPLPAGPAAHLAQALGRDADPRWHLTLAFLGERDDPGPVVEALRVVAVAPFRLALGGAGTFGGGRVLWVGVREGAAALTALAGEVAAVCGVPEDRPYRPHLTVRRGRDLDAGGLAQYAGPAHVVDGFGLYESAEGLHVLLQAYPGGAR